MKVLTLVTIFWQRELAAVLKVTKFDFELELEIDFDFELDWLVTKQNFSVNATEFLNGSSVDSQNVFKRFQEVLRIFSRGFRKLSGYSQEVLRGSQDVLGRFSRGSHDVLRRFSDGSQRVFRRFSIGYQKVNWRFSGVSQRVLKRFSICSQGFLFKGFLGDS